MPGSEYKLLLLMIKIIIVFFYKVIKYYDLCQMLQVGPMNKVWGNKFEDTYKIYFRWSFIYAKAKWFVNYQESCKTPLMDFKLGSCKI